MTGRDKRKRQEDRAKLSRLLGVRIEPGVRIKLADGYYRLRRGKLVRIPDKWVGQPAYFCGEMWWRRWLRYKRPRMSALSRKERMRLNNCGHGWRWRRGRPGMLRSHPVPREKREGWSPAKGMGHPRHRAPRHVGTKWLRKLGMEEDEG